MKKKDLADEDGNALPKVDPATDLGQLTTLLEWARIRGFRIGPAVQIGSIVVQVEDLRPRVTKDGGDETAAVDIWKAHGYDGDEK